MMTIKLELSYLLYMRSIKSIQTKMLIKQSLMLFVNFRLNSDSVHLFLIILTIMIQQFTTFLINLNYIICTKKSIINYAV